jgi:hypothetical protein
MIDREVIMLRPLDAGPHIPTDISSDLLPGIESFGWLQLVPSLPSSILVEQMWNKLK